MSDSTKQPDGDPRDAARDRLVDRLLSETLGGERPPDLTQPILDRLDAEAASPRRTTTMGTPRAWIVLLTTAASLAIVVGFWAAEQRGREVAKTDRQHVESAWSTGSKVEAPASAEEMRELAMEQPEGAAALGRSKHTQLVISDETRKNGSEEGATITAEVTGGTVTLEPLVGDLATVTADQDLPFGQGSFNQPESLYSSRQAVGARFNGIESASMPSAALPQPASPANPWILLSEKQPAEGVNSRFHYYADEGRRETWEEYNPANDRYAPLQENDFIKPLGGDALSTFSVDVDTASYSNVRQYLLQMRRMPPAGAVRVEELVNYFDYAYPGPAGDSEDPFAASMEVGVCPWNAAHRLVRIGVQGKRIDADKRPLTNLVFLIDVSGSMQDPNKLPLVKAGLEALTERLGENDRVAIVVYAGSEGVVLPSTSGERKDEIRSALGRLRAGGSTAGGAGLRLAYEIAEQNQIPGGVNRVVLCTDGDFNVGLTGTEELAKLVETRAKETGVFLTVLGFGRGNLNDEMLEAISGRGDGHYAYIDSEREARRVLSTDLAGTLVTIAKDVKLQVEFNPARVAAYRLIGYENRVMAAQDFNDDTKDAGEIGAGHTVTALYEVVPVGAEPPAPPVDGLKYQPAEGGEPTAESQPTIADSTELLTLKIRYKQPAGGASKKLEFPLEDPGDARRQETSDFRWASAVAEFGLLLRESRHVGSGSYEQVLELARPALGDDPRGERAELLDLVRRAQELSGR